jgi:hypothetical protein
MHVKSWYAEQVLIELQDDFRNVDFKIDEREVYLRIDAIVNEMATANYFSNWKLTGAGIDEGFITTWEPVTVVDQANGLPSYLTLPSNYAALPKNAGIDEIYPIDFKDENQSSCIIMSHSDYRRFLSNPAGKFSGRLAGYPEGNIFKFTTCEVKKKYGNMGVRLVVKDSSQIGATDIYPIPSDMENKLITTVVEWFRARRLQPTDSVRDNKDAVNSQ